MRVETAILRSRVARRIFVSFVVCALVPIAALALVSLTHVTGQLNEQTRARLADASKAHGMSIYERLRFLEAELTLVAAQIAVETGLEVGTPSQVDLAGDVQDRFDGLAVAAVPGGPYTLAGRVCCPRGLRESERAHVQAGSSVVWAQSSADAAPQVFIARAAGTARAGAHDRTALVIGQVNGAYLWGLDGLPTSTGIAVFDESGGVLASSLPGVDALATALRARPSGEPTGYFEWSPGGETHLASAWTIFLKPRFHVPAWHVVLSQSRATVLEPTAAFRTTFLLVLLMSIWVVLLLSIVQIRRSLVPLEELRRGTRHIAGRAFEARVSVDSGDEFEELAQSFNSMAATLGRQFNALTVINDIDRAVLSKWKTEDIVETVLTRLPRLISCDAVAVGLVGSDEPHRMTLYLPGSPSLSGKTVALSREEADALREQSAHLVTGSDPTPGYLAPLGTAGLKHLLVLPVAVKQELSGMIVIGNRHAVAIDPEDRLQARQIADQVAVALSNARLVEDLDEFSWGTLHALARAIDAKSPWTAGHSERVTALAVRIGQALGLSAAELDTLRRGGLLHDVGKIGVPAHVLDKQGELTDEEAKLMRDHVRIGARILEPLAAFADVLPIVLEHHEWYDGTGYPNGLGGDRLSLSGRIFAVADVFDALTSARPYRAALTREQAVDRIRCASGSQFDPTVVAAFLQVVGRGEAAALPARVSAIEPQTRQVHSVP